MLKTAFIFPGQGAQYVGMGQDFQRNCAQSQEVFARAEQILGWSLSELIFSGPAEKLARTDQAQVAIFTVSIAALRAVQAADLPVDVQYTAGLSLGEYTALVAAGALSFAAALQLVQKRGQYMEQASQQNPGGMLALVGLNLAAVEKICQQTRSEIANLNCPGQIVISGNLTALAQAQQQAKARGAKKALPLKVSGAFHSSLMQPAAEQLNQALAQTQILTPRIPVISNVTAAAESSPEEIKQNLARQLVCRTRWADSIELIKADGVRHFLEIGPGKVLKGLLRKIDPELKVYNIETTEDLESFRKEC